MGVVYMAEQTEPFDRRVALKIIKPGMDTGLLSMDSWRDLRVMLEAYD